MVPSTTTIQFDIAWDNSWNTAAPSSNWDAVWVFVKTQVCALGASPWNHTLVSTTSGQHSVSGGVLQVDAVTDGMGVFIRRNAGTLGSGNIATSTVTLQFQSAYVVASTNYKVIGIEMVYVPQGAFSLGDGSSTTTQSLYSFGTSGASATYNVTSEAALGIEALYNVASSGPVSRHQPVIAAFPKGYNAFYCMKYEISQQQYSTFLNLLTFSQQITRTAASPTSAIGTAALAATSGDNRNSIEIQTPGIATSTPAIYGNDLNNNNVCDEATDGGTIACNYLNWYDLIAYLDWAALRPMTELEFEKAARGTNGPVTTEFPWGTTTINQAISSAINNGGNVNEVSTSSLDGLCVVNGGASSALGPLRVGCEATASTTRTGAGASFYGIMDLGGNVWEQAFQVGHIFANVYVTTAAFTGSLGNGTLGGGGDANEASWAGGPVMAVVRGGNWEYAASLAQTSDRTYVISTTENATRTRRTGGRGVR